MLDPRLSHLEHEPVLGVPKDPTGFERHCSLGLVAGAMRSKQSPVSAGDGVRAVDSSYGKEQHIYRRGQQLWMVIPLDLSWRDLSTVCRSHGDISRGLAQLKDPKVVAPPYSKHSERWASVLPICWHHR